MYLFSSKFAFFIYTFFFIRLRRLGALGARQQPLSLTQQEKNKTLRIVLLIKQSCHWLSDGAAAPRSVFLFFFVTAQRPSNNNNNNKNNTHLHSRVSISEGISNLQDLRQEGA